jgi:molybdopterin-guanine dinucleotide biosynthesis protein A
MRATDALPAGVVIAGGRGRRLGLGPTKAWTPLAGATLLERALERLARHCGPLWVAAPAVMPLPGNGYRRVDDAEGAAGPLAGLCAALRAVGEGEALVLGVDYPLVRDELLALLGGAPQDGRAVVPRVRGRLQPLLARYPAAWWRPLRAALRRGERALVPAVLELRPRLLDEPALGEADPELVSFFSVNTRADLERAERRLALDAP